MDSMAPSRYPYKALQSLSSYEIRLLTIFPGEHDDPIELGLNHLNLLPPTNIREEIETSDRQLVTILQDHNASHDFEAISYCWGEESCSVKVDLDGQEHLVTPTLETMFRYLRTRNEPRKVWIDALCLNQDDEEEKRSQIPLMHLIYASAKRVIVWLGELSADGKAGIQYVQDNCAAISEGETHRISDETGSLDWPIDLLMTGPLSQRDIKNITAFFSLLSRPWWYRAWIVQEMGLARDVLFQCGSQTLPYAQLRATLHITRQVYSSFMPYLEEVKDTLVAGKFKGEPWPASAMNNALTLEYCRVEIVKHHSSIPLSPTKLSTYIGWYLCYSRGRLCLKAHDRTFSILGIAGPRFREYIVPDYSSSLPEHNRNVVRASWAATGNLDVILLSQHSIWLPESSSWAPDWSAPERASPLHLNSQVLEHPLRVNALEVRMPQGSPALSVPGRILTHITKSRFELENIVDGNAILGNRGSAVDGSPEPTTKRRWWVFRPEWERENMFQQALKHLPKGHSLWAKHLELFLISFCILFYNHRSELIPDELQNRTQRSLKEEEHFLDFDHFWSFLEYLLTGRTICETSDARVLIAPDFTAAGDVLAVLGNCSNLVVLRKCTGNGGYRVIGDAYLLGVTTADTHDEGLEDLKLF